MPTYPRRWLSVLLVAWLLATIPPAAAQSTVDVTGTWTTATKLNGKTFRHTLVISNQTGSGAVSGTWDQFGAGKSARVTGKVSGSTMTLVNRQGAASYSYRYTGTIRARGQGLVWAGKWQGQGGLKGFFTATRGAPEVVVEVSPSGGDDRSATIVICDRDMTANTDNAVLECTAQVTDASGQPDSRAPTGAVAWTADVGAIAPATCTLHAGSGSTAWCAVALRARAGEIPIGTAPPVTAAYPGDTRFGPSEGSPQLYGAANSYDESDQYGPGCNPAAGPYPSFSCGDPVNPATGNLSLVATDITIAGRGPALEVARAYNSLAAADGQTGRFGAGWSDAYGARIEPGAGNQVTVYLGTGATVPFTAKGKRFTAPSWVTATLTSGPKGRHVLTLADQRTMTFDRSGRLVALSDRAGEPITLAYADDDRHDTLATATDASGRVVSFTSDEQGRVATATDPAGRIVRYGYDEAGDLVTVTDVADGLTIYAYDERHRLVSLTDPTGAVTTSTYDDEDRVVGQVDPLGNRLAFAYNGSFPDVVTAVTDANGVRSGWVFQGGVPVTLTRAIDANEVSSTSFVYDDRLRLVGIVDANRHLWRNTRDEAGNIVVTTDPLGRTTRVTWDERHNVTSVTTPLGTTTRIRYDDRGLPIRVVRAAGAPEAASTRIDRDDPEHPSDVTSVTDPLGAVTTFRYDEHGAVTGVVDALGNTGAMTRDVLGWIRTLTDPLGAVTTVDRDPFGDPAALTDALGATTLLARDAAQRPASITNALGHPTMVGHDGAGRPIEIILPDGTSLGTGYDAIGGVISQTDGSGAVKSFARDPQGRVTEWRDALGSSWQLTWDPVDQLIRSTDPLGVTTQFSWDAAGQLVAIDYSDHTPDVTYAYDADGNRTSMTDGTGTTGYVYDALGRLTSVTDGAGHTVSTRYDDRGGITKITYPDGRVVERDLDALGRLVAVRDGLGNESAFEWDAAGRLVGMRQGDGSTTTQTYDARGGLLGISVTSAGAEDALLSFTYERDPLGRVASIREGERSITATRDTRGRLLAVGDESFAFDTDEDLTSLRGADLTYDVAGRLLSAAGPDGRTTFSNDAAGRRVAATSAAGESSAYTWDAAGRLAAAGEERYAYDGDGLRTSAVATDGSAATFDWLRTGGLPVLLGDGVSSYVYGPGGSVIEEIRADGTILWLHPDQAGSIRAVTDEYGVIVGTADWDMYGMPVDRTGEWQTRIGYQGHYTDPESGFQYLLARTYDPSTARFLSVDPRVFETRQPYAFAAGDPMTFGDPSGALPLPLGGSGGPSTAEALAALGFPPASAVCAMADSVADAASGTRSSVERELQRISPQPPPSRVMRAIRESLSRGLGPPVAQGIEAYSEQMSEMIEAAGTDGLLELAQPLVNGMLSGTIPIPRGGMLGHY